MRTTSQLIHDLHWHKDPDVQQRAMNQLIKIHGDELKQLIQPFGDKAYWENAALVLQKIGYPRIKPVIPELLEWLADLNWPGAYVILDLLGTVEKSELDHNLINALHRAEKDDDFIWIAAMKQLLINIGDEHRFESDPEIEKILALASLA